MALRVVTVTETSAKTNAGMVDLTIIGAREDKQSPLKSFVFWGKYAKYASATLGVGMKINTGALKFDGKGFFVQ